MISAAFSLKAASGTWTNNVDGNWSDTTQWLGGVVADGSGFTADFSTINLTANRTVTLDAGHTLTTLKFGDTVPDFNWTLSGANTLTLAGTTPTINVLNQSATISSVIDGTVGMTKIGPGALTLNGSAVNTYSGATTLNAGSLKEDFSNLATPTDLIKNTSVLSLGGGALTIFGNAAGTTAQTFASTTLAASGGSSITVINNATAANLTLGAITRNNTSTLKLNLPSAGAVSTTSGTASQVLVGGTGNVPYVFVTDSFGNLLDFGAKNSGNTLVGQGSTLATAQYTVTTGAGNFNIQAGGTIVDVVSPSSGVTWTASTPVWGGVRFNANIGAGFIAPSGPRNIQIGAILITTNVGPNNVTISGSGGIDQGSATAKDFILAQDNPYGEILWTGESLFRNNGSGGMIKLGRGTVNCSIGGGGNDFRGQTYLYDGVLAIVVNSDIGNASVFKALNLNGGTLLGTATFTMDNAGLNPRPVTVLGNGGGLAAAAGTTLTVNGLVGSVAGAGPLTIGIPPSSANGNVAGLLPGTGLIANGQAIDTANATPIFANGTVFLTGANFYFGGTVIQTGTAKINGINNFGGANYGGLTFNGGTLQYATAASGSGSLDISSGAGIYVASGGGIIDLSGNSVTYANAIGKNGSGSLTVTSSVPNGVLTLSGANTYAGGTTVNGPMTLTVNNVTGSATGSGSVTVNTGATLSGTGIIFGNVTLQSGALATFTQGSPLTVGVVTLNNNTATVNVPGGTPLGAGNYTLMNYTAAGSSGAFNSVPTYTGAGVAAGTASTITTSGGVVTLAVVVSGVSATWTNDVDGNWTDATKWSSNPSVPHLAGDSATLGVGSALRTVTLNANQTVGGITMSNLNSFVIANSGNALTLDNTGSGAAVNVSGGTANLIQTAIALKDNATITVSSGNALAITGVISNTSAAKSLLFNGAGTNILSAANTYGPAAGSVGTTLTGGGVLKLGNSSALGAGDVNITGNSTVQAGAASLSVGNNLAVSAGVIATVDNNGNGLVLGGAITGNGALNKIGNGTLTLNGNNSYSGNTAINAGALSISSAANAANTPIILNGGDLIGNGTFTANNNIGIGLTTGSAATTALIDVPAGQSFTAAGVIASAGNTGVNSLTVNSGAGSTGTLVLSNANTFSGPTIISNGVLQISRPLALQNSTLNYSSGSLQFESSLTAATLGGLTGTNNLALTNLTGAGVALTVGNNNSTTTYTGFLTNTGSLIKSGTGALTIGSGITGGASYGGNTTVNAGTLTLGGVGNISAPGNFDISGSLAACNVNIADTAVVSTVGAIYLADNNGILGAPAICTLTLKNSAVMSAASLSYGNNNRPLTGTAVTVQDSAALTITNNLDLVFVAGSTAQNTALNLNGGALAVGNFIASSGAATHQSTIHFNGGILKPMADSATFLPALTGMAANVDGGGLKIDTTGFNISIAAVLRHGTGTPDGGLTKLGAGTLTLSGANTYTGNTIISNGVLILDATGSITTSPNIVVNGGATLDVSATGGFTLGSQTLSNSVSTAILNGNLNTASGTLGLKYASGTPAFNVTNGTLTLAAATVVQINNIGTALALGNYKIISTNLDGTGFVSGTAPTSVTVGGNGLAGGAAASLQIVNSELYLVVVPGVNLNPPPIQFSISGNTLNLGWPTNLGWTLQTNSVDLANTNYWFAYPGSAAVTNLNITIDPAKANVFYRLVYP